MANLQHTHMMIFRIPKALTTLIAIFQFCTLFMGPMSSLFPQTARPEIKIEDFQEKSTLRSNKSPWYVFSDSSEGGKSKISFNYVREGKTKDRNICANYVLGQGTYRWTAFAALACSLNLKDLPSGIQAIAYEFKGHAHKLEYRSSNIDDYAFYHKEIPASECWATVTIPLSELVQPSWGKSMPFSEKELNALVWRMEGKSEAVGSLSIDNVRLVYTPQLRLNSRSVINGGLVNTIHSSVLHEDRDIWISLPSSLEEIKNSKKRYPVIYMLDGNLHLPYMASLGKLLGPEESCPVLPEVIIVGIANTWRWRDLSPSHINTTPFNIDTTYLTPTGGGGNFMRFIKKELIPYIDSLYPTNSKRTFVGHSLGGLTVLNTLIHQPELFDDYIAIDPSLWWDDKLLIRQTMEKSNNIDLHDKRLFLAIANTVGDGYDTSKIMTDASKEALHMRCIFEFADILHKEASIALKWTSKYYPNDGHKSAVVIGLYDALRYMYRKE